MIAERARVGNTFSLFKNGSKCSECLRPDGVDSLPREHQQPYASESTLSSCYSVSRLPLPSPLPCTRLRMHRNSLLATTDRQGRSHSTEAWQLPPPAFRQQGDAAGGESGYNRNAGGGAYLGLFRPPGGAKNAMGFHMCVAVIPGSEEGGAGAVAETFAGVKPPSPDPDPEPRHGNKVRLVLLMRRTSFFLFSVADFVFCFLLLFSCSLLGPWSLYSAQESCRYVSFSLSLLPRHYCCTS